jgi:hypothetical protein
MIYTKGTEGDECGIVRWICPNDKARLKKYLKKKGLIVIYPKTKK